MDILIPPTRSDAQEIINVATKKYWVDAGRAGKSKPGFAGRK